MAKTYKLTKRQASNERRIVNSFRTADKVLFTACCGSGKTIVTLEFVRKLIKRGNRVAISAHSTKGIREQWVEKIIESNLIPLNDVQVVCAELDVPILKKAGYPATSVLKASNTKPVTIFIPQTVRSQKATVKRLGKFDYFVVDETHEYLPGKSLKAIISKFPNGKSKVLGLSGSAFDLMRPGQFFQNDLRTEYVVYSMPDALEDGIISNVKLRAEHFKFKFKKEFYTKLELNSKGEAFLKSQASAMLKVKELLDAVPVTEKALVRVPYRMSEDVESIIKRKYGTKSVVRCTYDNDDNYERQQRFKTDPNVRFMVVVNMYNIGWDFPELQYVLDLSFTLNPKKAIQTFSRLIRRHPNKTPDNLPTYIYCTDRRRSPIQVQAFLAQCLSLTTEQGMLTYSGQRDSKEGRKLKAIALKCLHNPTPAAAELLERKFGMTGSEHEGVFLKMWKRKVTKKDCNVIFGDTYGNSLYSLIKDFNRVNSVIEPDISIDTGPRIPTTPIDASYYFAMLASKKPKKFGIFIAKLSEVNDQKPDLMQRLFMPFIDYLSTDVDNKEFQRWVETTNEYQQQFDNGEDWLLHCLKFMYASYPVVYKKVWGMDVPETVMAKIKKLHLLSVPKAVVSKALAIS